MKWYKNLTVFFFLLYPSWAYAVNSSETTTLSSEAQLFVDRLMHARCIFNGKYDDEYCVNQPKNQKIIEELTQRNPRPFYGHIDLFANANPSPWGGRKQIDKKDYIKWAKSISVDDWLDLTNHIDAGVRVSAFQALVNAYPETDFIPIIIAHIGDTEVVIRMQYDEFSYEKVGDVFFDIVTESSFFWLQVDKFTTEQREKLLTVLLTTPNELDATSDFVLQEELRPELYSLLREALQKNIFDAGFYSLAKYRKSEDIPLILDYLVTGDEKENNTLVRKFTSAFSQDELFNIFKWEGKYHSLITDRFRKQALVKLYGLVTSTLDKEDIYTLSMYLLDTTELSIKQRHIHQELLFNAVMQNNIEVHEKLLWYLWSHENKLNIKVYEYLVRADPQKALDLTKKTFRNIENLYQQNKNLSWNHVGYTPRVNVDKLVSTMLNFLLAGDGELAFDVIKEHLEKPNSLTYPVVTQKIIESQNKQFIDILLDTLESDVQHIVHYTIWTLRSFEDEALNQKIVTSLIRNRNMRTSDNWKWLYRKLEESGILNVEMEK